MTKHHQGRRRLGVPFRNICHCRNPSLLDRARRIAEIQKQQLLSNYFVQTGQFHARPADEMYLRIRGSLSPRLALQVGAKYSISVIFKICLKRNQYWNVLGWLAAQACTLPIPLLGANKQNLRRNSKRIFSSSAICR